MENQDQIILAIANGSRDTSYLAILPGISVEEVYRKMQEILYEFGFADEVNPDMVTMDVLREGMAVLIQNDIKTIISAFDWIGVVNCHHRKFEVARLKEPMSLDEFFNQYGQLDIYDLKNSPAIENIEMYSEIKPKYYDPEANNGWESMAHRRPEQSQSLIIEMTDEENKLCGLMYTTKPVLVCTDGRIYIDFRRKFKDFRKWIWNRLEGIKDTENVFWMELSELPLEINEEQS